MKHPQSRQADIDVQPTGQISDHVHVLGGPFAWLYLIDAPRPILLDTGMTFMAQELIGQVTDILDGRPLYAAAHTHSHFDHLGCTAQLQDTWPDMLPLGHPRVGKILERPGALATISMLNNQMSEAMGSDDRFAVPNHWQGVEDGITFDLGDGVTMEARYTPGHTRDTVTWMILPDGLAVMGEACGVPIGSLEEIQVEFLTNPDQYLAGIKIIQSLDPAILGLPHVLYVNDHEQSRQYLRNSIDQTHGYIARLEGYFAEAGGDAEAVFDRIFAEDFTGGLISQPEPAFRLNLQAQVTAIGRRLGL